MNHLYGFFLMLDTRAVRFLTSRIRQTFFRIRGNIFHMQPDTSCFILDGNSYNNTIASTFMLSRQGSVNMMEYPALSLPGGALGCDDLYHK